MSQPAAMQLREIAACQFALARMDMQCPAGLHRLTDFSHTADGTDELVAKAYGGGLRKDPRIDNFNIRLRKGALLPRIKKIANVAGGHSRRHASSFRDLICARRRRQSSWHRLAGIYQRRSQQYAAGDQDERYQSFRHGTLLVHYIKKLGEVGGPHRTAAVAPRLWPPFRSLPKGLTSPKMLTQEA